MKRIFIFMLLIAISLLMLFLFNKSFLKKNTSVTIKNITFKVTVAKTDQQKTKGLSIYESLPNDQGMIFLFKEKGNYAFWMKDMKFSIDIIYISDDKITDIFESVPYPRSSSEKLTIIKPKNKANYVLEINSGLSKKYNFKTGDIIKINL